MPNYDLARMKWGGVLLGAAALYKVDEIPLNHLNAGDFHVSLETAALWAFRVATVVFIFLLIRSISSGVRHGRELDQMIAREKAMKRGEDRFRD
ncbi:hypothetical protein [uncultured Roseibium sp.]|uniref:hypothetical protein n=1 Tax=uncultured Roseibium sp. TaxID=1936171 RepID=UPI00262A9D83|nr:hypothetical protein [uncultured Roseibium sp.]